ncbi:MAG: CHAT domain-containing protein, partial [Myxococcota bacterium]
LDVEPPASEHQGRGSVVVADPRGDLKAARTEAKTVSESLGELGDVTVHTGTSATAERFVAGLERARIVHYAGHAQSTPESRWNARLLLADDSELVVSELMGLEHAPELVALMGCETGQDNGAQTLSGFGFPAALLLKGTKFVIGSVRPLDDRLSLEFARVFYRNLQKTDSGVIPINVAFQTAVRTLASRGLDGSALRLFTQN